MLLKYSMFKQSMFHFWFETNEVLKNISFQEKNIDKMFSKGLLNSRLFSPGKH